MARFVLSRFPEPHSVLCGARRTLMTLGTLLLILVVLALIGAIPAWPYSRGWGYAPSGIFGIALILVVVLLVSGRL
jgi:hypothetical protein